MDGVTKCPFCNSDLVPDPSRGCGFCPECKRESVMTLDPKVREAFIEAVSNIEDVKKLFEMQKFSLCLKKIDSVITVHVDCPDLWFMKSMLSMSNMQKYNYCTCKARSLLQQNKGLICLTMEDIDRMKKIVPKGWTAAPAEQPPAETAEPADEKRAFFGFVRKS